MSHSKQMCVCVATSATRRHEGVNQNVGGLWRRHTVVTVLFGCSPS